MRWRYWHPLSLIVVTETDGDGARWKWLRRVGGGGGSVFLGKAERYFITWPGIQSVCRVGAGIHVQHNPCFIGLLKTSQSHYPDGARGLCDLTWTHQKSSASGTRPG